MKMERILSKQGNYIVLRDGELQVAFAEAVLKKQQVEELNSQGKLTGIRRMVWVA